MKRLAPLALLLIAACADDNATHRTFANNDLELAVGNGARMGCTCMFVMKMGEDYCRAWVKASPDVAKIAIDTNAKTVESSAFVSFAAKAHFVDERHGCVLE